MTSGSVYDVIRRIPAATLESLQFLSRYPVWKVVSLAEKPDFAKNAFTFPLAGGLIAFLPVVIVALLGLANLSPELLAFILVFVSILITGALHEDGLADVADGFWGGQTRERKLAIMRDSTIGTYGTLALILAVAGRWALWASVIAHAGLGSVWVMVICVFALSRSSMLVPWALLPSARPGESAVSEPNKKDESGLSARFGDADRSMLQWGAMLSLPFAVFLLISGLPGLFCLIGLAIATISMMSLGKHHIGGHTGDVLGATQQVAELGMLFGLAIGMGLA